MATKRMVKGLTSTPKARKGRSSGSSKVHVITNRFGLEFKVKKMRTNQSFGLPTYHVWSEEQQMWIDLALDTLAEVRKLYGG